MVERKELCPREFLDQFEVNPLFQHMSSKSMSKTVGIDVLFNPRPGSSPLNDLVNRTGRVRLSRFAIGMPNKFLTVVKTINSIKI